MDKLLDLILHTDDALLTLVAENVTRAYFVIFMMIMLETGMIFFPFLPGDGLLFSAGVIASTTEFDVKVLLLVLVLAATIGNLINYHVGRFLGGRLRKSNNYFIKRFLIKHLPKTEAYYKKHGNRAIILGRFFPIIRTYVPFVAGLVKMERSIFFKYTAIGAILWICTFLLAGFYLGKFVWVKNNYGLIFLMLVIITLIPFFSTVLRTITAKKQKYDP